MNAPTENLLQRDQYGFAHARVVRWELRYLRFAQTVWPLGFIVAILARRLGGTLLSLIASGVLVLCFAGILRARHSFGHQRLSPHRKGRIQLGEGAKPGETIQSATSWTLDGSLARVQTHEFSWRLKANRGDEQALTAVLTEAFGTPARLERRGSLRARIASAAIMMLGVVLVPLAINLESTPLLGIGVATALVAFGTFAALLGKAERHSERRLRMD